MKNFRLDLIKTLQSKGIEVHVACPNDNSHGSDSKVLSELGVKIHDVSMSRAGLNPFQDLYTCWALWRLMRFIRPDKVLGYT
ncbi:glycosyltransferase, partial [Salinivibrio sp. VYel6]|uniref:glycosyltransferase n=1 Tax=Salinivibrio sp. VYel6 TaxID=2490493 RepID=UPI00352A42B8